MQSVNIRDCSAEELIKVVYHELNQKANTVLSCAKLLADENYYGFVNDEQREVIDHLHQEALTICEIADWMRIWKTDDQD
ncbi:MAG: hypothetical protein KC423_19250 [Anaerolineales bacterium]|nr:hypothetical protein [Anaerolineales bacterium]